jgi:lipopolysaccharide export system protein LptA
MMLPRILPFLVLLAGVVAPVAAAPGRNDDQPVDITSDSSELLDKENRALFIGRVHAVQGSMTLDTARMTVLYRKAAKPGDDLQLQRIDASGGVTVVDPTQRAKGNFGIYDLDRKIITLIGNVTLTRGDNTVNGSRLVMDRNTGRSTVDGNAVGAPAGTAPASGGRVTGHFSVPKHDATPPK